ncbi:MAG: hypothetical protein R2774_07230 [Saprospiraceae bacterium]
MRTKIKINNVQSLTDARYYAAMGVHYLGFSPSDVSPIAIKSIVEWVEGPSPILDIITEADLQCLNQLPNIKGIHLLRPIEVIDYKGIIFENIEPDSDALPGSHFQVVTLEKPFDKLENTFKKKLLQWSNEKPLWLTIPINFVESYTSALPFEGLVLENKMVEQAVGIQDFDDMDRVFDLLNNI